MDNGQGQRNGQGQGNEQNKGDEKEDEKKTGLHLTDKVIHRISGPVSMDYLVPFRGAFMKRDLVSTPIIMLWGDIHRDDSGLCDPCLKEKGCYPIYDKDFLKELDKLAADYPVDFYTEFSKDFAYHHNDKNILFGRFLQQTTKGCHMKALRPRLQYESQCPTKYIRWHYADPRFMNNTMERYLYSPILDAFDKDTMYDKIDAWRAADPKEAGGIVPLSLRLKGIRKVIQERNTESKTEEEAFLKKDIQALQFNLVHHILGPLHGGILKGDVANIKYRRMFDVYAEHLLGPSEPNGEGIKKSVILKQFSKIGTHDAFHYGDFLANAFVHSVGTSMTGTPYLMEMEGHLKTISPDVATFIRLFFKEGDEFERKERHLYANVISTHGESSVAWIWYGFAYVCEILFHMEAFLVDVYTLLRMMKPPQGSSPPYLALGYFGALHTHRMSRILQTPGLFNYTSMFHQSHNGAVSTRCITVSEDIYLARDLDLHASGIHKQNAAVRSYRQYASIITQEEQERRREQEQEQEQQEQQEQQTKEGGRQKRKSKSVKKNRKLFLSRKRK